MAIEKDNLSKTKSVVLAATPYLRGDLTNNIIIG
jgi:hypothetical protein